MITSKNEYENEIDTNNIDICREIEIAMIEQYISDCDSFIHEKRMDNKLSNNKIHDRFKTDITLYFDRYRSSFDQESLGELDD